MVNRQQFWKWFVLGWIVWVASMVLFQTTARMDLSVVVFLDVCLVIWLLALAHYRIKDIGQNIWWIAVFTFYPVIGFVPSDW